MRKFLLIITCLLIGAFCAAVSLQWLLPLYVNSSLLPELRQRYDLSGFKAHLQRVGFARTIAGPLSLSDGGGAGMFVDEVEVRYSLTGLFAGRVIDEITVRGLRLDLALQEKSIRIKGATLPSFNPDDGLPSAEKTAPVQFPSIHKINIPNALVTFWDGDRPFRVPLSLQVETEKERPASLAYRFELTADSTGQTLSLSGMVDPDRDALEFSGDVRLDLPVLAAIFATSLPLTAAGQPRIHFDGKAPLSSPARGAFSLQGSLTGVAAGTDDIGVEVLPPEKGGTAAFALQADAGGFRLTLPECRTRGAISLLLQEMEIEGNSAGGQYYGELRGTIASISQQISSPFRITFSLGKDGSWRVEGHAPEDDRGLRAAIETRYGKLSLDKASLSLSGEGTLQKGAAHYEAALPAIVAGQGSAVVRAGNARINGSLSGAFREGKLELLHSAEVELPEIEVSTDKEKSLYASLSLREKDLMTTAPFFLDSTFALVGGKLESPGDKLLLRGIFAEIPFRWPMDSGKGVEKKGSFAIGDIGFEGKKLAELSGKVTLGDAGYRFVAEFESGILPISRAEATGEVRLTPADNPEIRADLKVDRQALRQTPIRLFGLSIEMEAGGEVQVDAALHFDAKSGLIGKTSVEIGNGIFKIPAQKAELEGVRLVLSFDHLPELRSAPARLQFERAQFGDYRLRDGRVDFQIESPDSLLIEKGRFKWAGGTVHALAVRLSPEKKDFTAELYCDRLNLAELLKQFGIKNASGEGTVNGSIPVVYKDGKISFEDGFLYSTPGGGGSIRVKAMDQLTAGIPRESLQFKQLDFAGAALADFSYNWVKLSLDSEGEDVLLRMTMDGRPAEPLPFRYDQKIGTFSRLTASSEHGIDQPIVLDVNFRIPFNELLGYGKSIKQVMDLMQ